MPLFERQATDILQLAISELTNNSRINRVSPGSKARAILETVSNNLNIAYKTFDTNLTKAFLSGASGQYIDLIGELVNTPRIGSSVARASSSAKVIKFYVKTGTFGDINSGLSITIPANTILSTRSDGNGVNYKTTSGIVLTNSASEQFVSVEATVPGEVSNLGNGTLNFHNFANYSDSSNNTLLVTNISGIFNGSNIEDDINYKFRISRSVLSAEASNQTAILLAALSTPGVANVILQNRFMGIGTFKLLIKSITPSVPLSLIDDVQASISQVCSLGVYPIADKPKETGMQFVLTVIYNNGVSSDDQDSIESQIRSNISDYVNNLDIGQDFIFNQVVEQILSVSPSIKDIGSVGNPIDQILIYKESRLQDAKIKNTLIGNYSPAQDERVIIEPSLLEPITIFRKT